MRQRGLKCAVIHLSIAHTSVGGIANCYWVISVLEMSIILPTHDNDGQPIAVILQILEDRLCADFGGGFYAEYIRGGWLNPRTGGVIKEECIKYTIAVENPQANSKLREIAEWIGIEAKQQAIYIKYTNGIVEIIDIPEAITSVATKKRVA